MAPVFCRAGGVIDELLQHFDLPNLGILAELHELALGVLVCVVGQDSRIDSSKFLFVCCIHIKNEILFDNLKTQKICLILKAFFFTEWDTLLTLR